MALFARLCSVVLLLAGALVLPPPAAADSLKVRVVAANLTSGRHQTYSPDNANHSNPEGAGARILKALQPDIVAIQEFTTTIPIRQWINATFGEEFQFHQEADAQIPNGIISRFPIVASGKWDDPVMTNREFAWAKIALPGHREMWVISVHFYSQKSEGREKQATALLEYIRQAEIPDGALLVLAGDLNTRSREETCVQILSARFVTTEPYPKDPFGVEGTNASRARPYDWVLASPALDALEIPVRLAEMEFQDGLVFDTRDFPALDKIPPAQRTDSETFQMQHMAVVRDFELSASEPELTASPSPAVP